MECGLLSESVCKRGAVVVKTEPITDHYTVEARPFARGKFATVRRCRHRASGVEYAAKYMRKRRRASDVRHEILHEAHVLELSRKHPHIVRMHEVYETPSEIILLLELVGGGELQRVLDDEEVVAEAEARRLLRQILDGVAFLHQHNIAHLDLKPQNLLLTKPFPEGEVKLCDFGISRLITKGIEIREIVGTPDYVAPEVLHYEPISLPTDMWSLGILTYVLLSGHSPFGGDTKQETFCNITRGSLDFPQDLFSGVSNCAKDFIQRLLLRNPKERMTAEECLSHPWLSGGGSALPGIQLTLSPKNALDDNLNRPENSLDDNLNCAENSPMRSPSPLYHGSETNDSAHHNSSSPKVTRNQTRFEQDQPPQTNGNMLKEDTDGLCHKLCNNINQSNGFCQSPPVEHNSDTIASVFCKSPSPKVTRSGDIRTPLGENSPFQNNLSSQYNGNGDIAFPKPIDALNNGDTSCPKVKDALDNNVFRQSKLSPKVSRSACESNSPFQKISSSQCNGKKESGEVYCLKVNSSLDNKVLCQSSRSVNVASSVETFSKNTTLHHYNGNIRDNLSSDAFDQSIDSETSRSSHDTSAFCMSHSLKVTRSVCQSSSLQCSGNEQENCETGDRSKSPQRNGSFRQSPSPGRREQKSRNSVDMMVSQFEGISKRIVFSEDICVDERVGMVY